MEDPKDIPVRTLPQVILQIDSTEVVGVKLVGRRAEGTGRNLKEFRIGEFFVVISDTKMTEGVHLIAIDLFRV